MLNWFVSLGLQYVSVVAATAAGYRWPILWPLVFLFYGSRQAALSVLGHDAIHKHIFPDSPRLNAVFGAIAFWPITVTLSGYKRFHLPHHAFLGTDKDPELFMMKRHWGFWSPKRKWVQVVRDLLGAGIPEIVDVQMLMYKGHSRDVVVPLLVGGMLVSGLVFLGLWLPVVLWLAAIPTVFFALIRLRGWTEHLGAPDGTWQKGKPSWIKRVLWFPGGIWLHAEHHAAPGIPMPILYREARLLRS